ncbi:hypothetical protein KNHN1_41950 [Pseudomonas guariconensis]
MVEERLLNDESLILWEGCGHWMLDTQDVRDLGPDQVFQWMNAVPNIRMEEMRHFRCHARRFGTKRDAAAQLVNQFGRCTPGYWVRLLH